ncbi:homeobox and leucine zipper protein Homez [Trichinella spiralis]|uniref:homeobox and leucine zipper protein Homez n=1 Tax=Trichinella spiralis TaxID=6334 RepID=UPI0001EFCA85|nr:homeobox and leucine zipper protein Homez [Trichinella spiralis]
MLAQKQAIEQFVLGAKGRRKVMRTSMGNVEILCFHFNFQFQLYQLLKFYIPHEAKPSSSAVSIAEAKNSIPEVEPLEEEEEEEEDGDDDEEEKIIQDANTSVEFSDELKFILELKNIWKTRVHYPQL